MAILESTVTVSQSAERVRAALVSQELQPFFGPAKIFGDSGVGRWIHWRVTTPNLLTGKIPYLRGKNISRYIFSALLSEQPGGTKIYLKAEPDRFASIVKPIVYVIGLLMCGIGLIFAIIGFRNLRNQVTMALLSTATAIHQWSTLSHESTGGNANIATTPVATPLPVSQAAQSGPPFPQIVGAAAAGRPLAEPSSTKPAFAARPPTRFRRALVPVLALALIILGCLAGLFLIWSRNFISSTPTATGRVGSTSVGRTAVPESAQRVSSSSRLGDDLMKQAKNRTEILDAYVDGSGVSMTVTDVEISISHAQQEDVVWFGDISGLRVKQSEDEGVGQSLELVVEIRNGRQITMRWTDPEFFEEGREAWLRLTLALRTWRNRYPGVVTHQLSTSQPAEWAKLLEY